MTRAFVLIVLSCIQGIRSAPSCRGGLVSSFLLAPSEKECIVVSSYYSSTKQLLRPVVYGMNAQ